MDHQEIMVPVNHFPSIHDIPEEKVEEEKKDVNDAHSEEGNSNVVVISASNNIAEGDMTVQPIGGMNQGIVVGVTEPVNVGAGLNVSADGDSKFYTEGISEAPVQVEQEEEEDIDSGDDNEVIQNSSLLRDGSRGVDPNRNSGGRVVGAGGRKFPFPGVHLNLTVQAMASSQSNFYTPLQKWEYENNLPVDGVTNVEEWAREVGLADDSDDDESAPKKQRTKMWTVPPKYAGTSFRMMITSADDPKSPSEDGKNSGSEADEDKIRKGKGKEKSPED